MKFPSDDDSVLNIDDDDVMNIPRYDERVIPVTSKNYGVRRLPIGEFIRLGCEDEFTLYIPPTSAKEPPEVKSLRDDLLLQMKRIVMASFQKTTTPEEREAGWQKHLQSRQFDRHGNDGYDFNVKIVTYPERPVMDRPSIPPSELKYLLNPVTKAGMTLELAGYGLKMLERKRLDLQSSKMKKMLMVTTVFLSSAAEPGVWLTMPSFVRAWT